MLIFFFFILDVVEEEEEDQDDEGCLGGGVGGNRRGSGPVRHIRFHSLPTIERCSAWLGTGTGPIGQRLATQPLLKAAGSLSLNQLTFCRLA